MQAERRGTDLGHGWYLDCVLFRAWKIQM